MNKIKKTLIPEWADEKLSSELPILRSRGQGQGMEYLDSFPDNVNEIGKHIAAFATSNTGMILVGISDSGDLKGLKGLSTEKVRENILQIIEGVCRGFVKPSITPTVNFAVENKKIVLVLSIPQGIQPIYYCNNIPFIRHYNDTRPAEPIEVIRLIQKWLSSRIEGAHGETTDEHNFLFVLASVFTNIIIFGDEIEKRNTNPWLDMSRGVFANCKSDLLMLASKDIAAALDLSEDLERLAQQIGQLATYQHSLGKTTWKKFVKLVQTATINAKKLKRERIDVISLPQELVETAMSTVKDCNDNLINLANRAEEMAEAGRVDHVQQDASLIGLKLLQLSHFGLDRLEPFSLKSLSEIGLDLHLIETKRLYSDGGKSIRTILKQIYANSEKLQSLTEGLSL